LLEEERKTLGTPGILTGTCAEKVTGLGAHYFWALGLNSEVLPEPWVFFVPSIQKTALVINTSHR
jgi:hypothetical protein